MTNLLVFKGVRRALSLLGLEQVNQMSRLAAGKKEKGLKNIPLKGQAFSTEGNFLSSRISNGSRK